MQYPKHTQHSRLCRITTGIYTGDGGLANAIVDIGFRVKYLGIVNHLTNRSWWFKEDTMGVNAYTPFGRVYGAGHIVSLDADGFTVSDNNANDDPNTLGHTYGFIALG